MKKTFKIAILALIVSMAAISCEKKVSNNNFTSQAEKIIASYPGVSVEIINDEAHLMGTFATEADKQTAIAAIKKIRGVKDVHDMTNVVSSATKADSIKTTESKK